MKINIPKSKDLYELILVEGEDWVKDRFKITGDQIDEILYGDPLPTIERQDKKAKNIVQNINWTKYNDDVERLLDEFDVDLDVASVAQIEQIAMIYQKRNKVLVKSEQKDVFIWDGKNKRQLFIENMVYEENINQVSGEYVNELMKKYKKFTSNLNYKNKFFIDPATGKTKEDGIQEFFLKSLEKKNEKNLELTSRYIEKFYQKKKIGRSVEMYFRKKNFNFF